MIAELTSKTHYNVSLEITHHVLVVCCIAYRGWQFLFHHWSGVINGCSYTCGVPSKLWEIIIVVNDKVANACDFDPPTARKITKMPNEREGGW